MPTITMQTGRPVGVQLDYAEVTSDIAITANTEGTAQAFVTGNAVVYDGTPVFAEVFAVSWGSNTTTNPSLIVLTLDGAVLGQLWQGTSWSGTITKLITGVYGCRRLTPSAGSHTISAVSYTATAGSTTYKAGAGGATTNLPAFLRVTQS